MPRRVIIHAGFHKTGTTAIQQTLRLNRPLLKPALRSVLRPMMREVMSAARVYSAERDPLNRARFHNRFGTLLYEQPPIRRRVLCLSAPDLSGHLPGRPGVPNYRAAVELAQSMADGAKLVFPRAELVFFYSTRAPQAWLKSVWAEHVTLSSMTLDADEFAQEYRVSSDLESIVDQIAEAVPARVERTRVEETDDNLFGTATRLLDLCEVPMETRDMMTRPAPPDRGPDAGQLDELLNLNRTIRDKGRLQAAKRDVIYGPSSAANEGEPQ